ncbi:MAG: hypothetical protein KDD62_13675 [Bdellovibrionales bacterium]|nr:hypothetical protein [Bdellovibrionales bacterium]
MENQMQSRRSINPNPGPLEETIGLVGLSVGALILGKAFFPSFFAPAPAPEKPIKEAMNPPAAVSEFDMEGVVVPAITIDESSFD